MSVPARALAGLAAALAAASALAQQPAPPPPSFAPPNMTQKGVAGMAAACAACHGTGGRTVAGSPVASLAGKPAEEIAQLLRQFKAGTKPATIMHQIAKGYGDDEIAAIADYYSRQR